MELKPAKYSSLAFEAYIVVAGAVESPSRRKYTPR